MSKTEAQSFHVTADFIHTYGWLLAEEKWRCAVLDADRFAILEASGWLLAEARWKNRDSIHCDLHMAYDWCLAESRWWAELTGYLFRPFPWEQPT